jgi:hypothetical protein
LTRGSDLYFRHTTKTFEFILIPHRVNCKSSKPHELILHFFLFSFFLLRVIHVIILMVLTWILRNLSNVLITETKLLFWFTLMTSQINIFIQEEAIVILANYRDWFCIYPEKTVFFFFFLVVLIHPLSLFFSFFCLKNSFFINFWTEFFYKLVCRKFHTTHI